MGWKWWPCRGRTPSDHCQVFHYDDVIMSTIASQITSLTIVYSTIYSGEDQSKHQSSASLAFCVGNSPGTGEFPAQMASNAENVSIWWRHHATERTPMIRFSLETFMLISWKMHSTKYLAMTTNISAQKRFATIFSNGRIWLFSVLMTALDQTLLRRHLRNCKT